VKYHLKNLYDKLGVNNRAMAVALYMSKTARTPMQDTTAG
jgi:DNA-binding CsgD family transcriptional regulator